MKALNIIRSQTAPSDWQHRWKSRVFRTFKTIIISNALIFSAVNSSHATVYFSYDAESNTVGSALPNPPFCGVQCGGGTESGQTVGRIGSTGGTPKGSQYFYWNIVQNQHDYYSEITQSPNLPTGTNMMGKTVYLAYYFRLDRLAGGSRFDIYQRGTEVQSAEKGVEIRGPGLRWVTSIGQWDSLVGNQSGRFTIWAGNPSYHLNQNLEHNDIYYPNQSGFSNANTQQLDYEAWHRVVLAVKLANTNTGSITLWIDGVMNTAYTNIQTVDAGTSNARIDMIEMGGTLCQPAYDCPPHTRKYDALLLTDDWQDIVNGGYLGGGTTSLSAPFLLPIQ